MAKINPEFTNIWNAWKFCPNFDGPNLPHFMWELRNRTSYKPFTFTKTHLGSNVKISNENFSFFQGWATNRRAICSEWNVNSKWKKEHQVFLEHLVACKSTIFENCCKSNNPNLVYVFVLSFQVLGKQDIIDVLCFGKQHLNLLIIMSH